MALEILYGAGAGGNIYEIDLRGRTSVGLLTTGFNGAANDLALNRTRNQLFLIDPPGNLQVWALQPFSLVQVATAGVIASPNGQVQNAAFCN